MKKDIGTRDDITLLVSTFYIKVKENELLAPFFKEALSNWDEHIEHLTNFWENSLFVGKSPKQKYSSNPLEAHIKVDTQNNHSITELHFGVWLNLWAETIDELFKGEYADNAKRRARKMSTFLYLKIFEARQKD